MKNISINIMILISILSLVSCAHHKDVRPGVDGEHRVRVVTDDKEMGYRDAISQAEYFCEQRGKYAAFIKEEEQYTGDIKEENYKIAKKVSKAAKVVGGSTWAFAKRRSTSSVGSLVGLTGAVADIGLGEGYTVFMKFKCI